MNSNVSKMRQVCILMLKIADKNDEKKFYALGIAMFIASILEIFSIGSFLPFIAVLIAPEIVLNNQIYTEHFSDLIPRDNVQVYIAILYALIVAFSSAFRIYIIYLQTAFAHHLGISIGHQIYKKKLYGNYKKLLSKSSADLSASILVRSNNIIYQIAIPLLTLLSSTLSVTLYVVTFLFFSPYLSLVVLTLVTIFFGAILYFTNTTVSNSSQIVNSQTSSLATSVGDTFRSLRELILYNKRSTAELEFRQRLKELRDAQSLIFVIGNTPRLVLEGFALVFFALLGLYAANKGLIDVSIVPVFATIVLLLQKLLPSCQLLFGSITAIKGGYDTFMQVGDDVQGHLMDQLQTHESLNFNDQICLENISFGYDGSTSKLFDSFSIEISKGSLVAIIGKTGTGKSTLIDIIMGILQPDNGTIKIDGEIIDGTDIYKWRNNFSFVSQRTPLIDGTFWENITYSKKLTDKEKERVISCSYDAQILERIENSRNGFDTIIHDDGTILSGGERQRIAIARALFFDREILVLDEATSALDQATEEKILEIIMQLKGKKTIIIICHGEKILKFCDKVIDLTNTNSTAGVRIVS